MSYIAKGKIKYEQGGAEIEAEWEAPLKTIDESFTHEFGVKQEWGAEQIKIEIDKITLKTYSVWVWFYSDWHNLEVNSFVEDMIKEKCLEQYNNGEYETVEE